MINDAHTKDLCIDELGFVPNNNRFKVLSKNGFKDFIGVKKTDKSTNMLNIYIGVNTYIKVTHDHKVFTSENEYKEAHLFNIGDYIYTSKGLQQVISIKESSSQSTYDLLHVEDDYCFYINSQDEEILIKNCLLLDELGFVNDAEAFYESVYPTISSSDESKVIITSTPKGMNFFYKLWVEAESGRNEYVAYDVKWNEHPDRDQKWYESQVSNLNAKSVDQEINCVSGDTYINVNGEQITIERLYNTLGGNTSNRVVWVDDGDIIIDR